MNPDKVLEMFGFLDNKVQDLLEIEELSINEIVERALVLGYEYALHENTDDTKLKSFDNSNDVGYADHEKPEVKDDK